MLIFNNLIIHNFGSYHHAEIDLRDRGFCMVSGQNLCKKDNALSNGSGKSMAWSGICFAITGETINGLHTNLKNINIDENEAWVSLDFNVDNDNYFITRYIEPKSDLKIIKNGIDVSGKGIRESEKKLGEYLPDLNKDLIASTIILGQGLPNKFTSFSSVGRKELLEKLTKSDFMIEDMKARIAKRAEELNRKLREYEDSLLINKTQLNNIETLINKVMEELTNIKKPDYNGQILALDTQITKDTNELANINKAIAQIEQNIEAINNQLITVREDKANNIALELEGYNKKYNEEFSKKMELSVKINAIKAEITKLKNITDICPTCGQKIPGVHKPDTTALEQELAKITAEYNTQEALLIGINQKHADNQANIDNVYKSQLDSLTASLNTNKSNLKGYKVTQDALNQNIKTNSANLTRLQYELNNYDKAVEKLNRDLDEHLKAKTKYTDLIKLTEEGKNEELEHLAVNKKLDALSKREYRGYILTNIINHLNLKAKDYSEIVFGTRELEIYLDGNSLDISYCGKLVESLSGGERTRVDLILQFAIRDLLNSHLNLSSNILVLDEITDFLDATSCAAVMQLVENELNTVESVFIISHHAESLNLSFDSELKIIKNLDGISEVF